MSKKRKRKIKLSGISFIEAMVSVFVLSFGILAIAPIISSNIRESADSRDHIIASFLAQEGIELIQNFRDNNWAGGKEAFHSNMFSNPLTQPDCAISYDSANAKNCGAGISKNLYINPSGFYTHSSAGGALTRFSRKIDLVYNNASQSMTVTSVASWNGSFPLNLSDCTVKNKCAYVSLVLAQWSVE